MGTYKNILRYGDGVCTGKMNYFSPAGYIGCIKDKDLTSPPASPSFGDAYIVASGATGDWAGKDNQIAVWNGYNWDFVTPINGTLAYVQDEFLLYRFTGSAWYSYFELDGLIIYKILQLGDSPMTPYGAGHIARIGDTLESLKVYLNGSVRTILVKDLLDSHASDPDAHHNRSHNLASSVDHTDVSISSPADGEVLTYDTSTSKWMNKAQKEPFALRCTGDGRWYSQPAIGGSLLSITVNPNTLYAIPFITARAITVDRIGICVATAVSNTTARLGIYKDNGTCRFQAIICLS